MSIPSNTSDASPSPQPDQAQSQAQQAQSQSSTQPAQPTKRSSRRANTAERRATHNAVERARRETLNGRFLDLAAMLPNLAAVRRPSKSAIVNSSIALIHNQQRSRIIAARELRLLNAEANALRQELNEWRARNSLPRVEEPIRSVDFGTLLNVEDVDMGEEMALGGRRSFDGEGFDEGDEYGEDGDEGELVSPESAVQYNGMNMGMPMRGAPMQYPAQQTQQQIAAQQQQQQQQQALFEQQKAAMARAHQAQLVQSQAQAQRYTPPTQPHHQSSQSQQMMFNESMFPADLYSGPTTQSWSQKAINSLATPPGSAHGHVSQKPSSYANTANSAFLSAQHGMFKPGSYPANGFLNPGSEDDQSDGSSHFSGVSDLMGAEQPFSFGLSNSNVGMNMTIGMGMGSTGMMGYPAVGMGGMMQMPPSPPHTGSPNHSNPQSRRPSVHIPAHGSNKSSPSPVPVSAQQYGMGLMM